MTRRFATVVLALACGLIASASTAQTFTAIVSGLDFPCNETCKPGWNLKDVPQSFSCPFADPLPSGAKVLSATVKWEIATHGVIGQTTISTSAYLNGNLLESKSVTQRLDCPFPEDREIIYSSATYSAGLPGYVYGGQNSLRLNASGAAANIGGASVELTYEIDESVFIRFNNDFDPANPQDQLHKFIPGSQVTGAPVQPSGSPRELTQTLHVNVLTPDGVKGSVKFELLDVSRLPGFAVNAPSVDANTNSDIDFGTANQLSQTVTIPRSGPTTTALWIRDYAAKARLKITIIPSSKKLASITIEKSVPRDVDANGMSDASWVAGGVTIYGIGTGATEDRDPSPTASGSPASGLLGDGFSAFEEYRGFVVSGFHYRTNPGRKDLFLNVSPDAALYKDFVYNLPLQLHFLNSGEFRINANGFSPEINLNQDSSSANTQRGLSIAFRSSSPLVYDPKDLSTKPAEAHDLAGFTFLDGEDHNLIVLPTGPRETPNTTKVVEVFIATLQNDALYCGSTAAPPTLNDDVDDTVNQMILPGDDGVLDTHPLEPGQFRGELVAKLCAEPLKWTIVEVFNTPEGAALLKSIVAHETAHGIDVDHDGSVCGDMMWSFYDSPFPSPTAYNSFEEAQIRTHRWYESRKMHESPREEP